jgi:chromosome partitioning protein
LGRVIAVTNQKGGVGKTTTAVNLGACVAIADQKVLLVDIDPQGNATSGVGYDKNGLGRSIYDVLMDSAEVAEVVVPTNVRGLFIVPSNIELTGAEIELVTEMGREIRLKRALSNIRDDYDFIFVDSPPSLGLLTINALTAADSVLIPIQCEYYALEGISQLMRTIEKVRRNLNPDLQVEGILLTMYDSRTNLSQQIVEEIRRFFGEKVYSVIVPRNVRLSEAPSFGKSIIEYDIISSGAEAYLKLAEEVIGAGREA